MKTNIKMRVTPEQSKKVQRICFNNDIEWSYSKKNVSNLEAPFLYIYEDEITYSFDGQEYDFESSKNKEVDADLFIRTNGTCEEQEPKTSKYPHFEKMLNNMNENFAEAIKMVEESEKQELENAKYKVGDFFYGKIEINEKGYIKIIEIDIKKEFPYKMEIMNSGETFSCTEGYLDNNFDFQKHIIEINKPKTDILVEQNNATNPNHYNQMKIAPNEYITANYDCFSWNTANVIKYVSRYKSKNGIEDLEKAIKYLQFEIEELKKAE